MIRGYVNADDEAVSVVRKGALAAVPPDVR
jgi:hypothetical protein